MDIVVVSYLMYLAISVALTVWVAKTLFKRGRIFLVDAFHGNMELADSVNHLLVVGFYLLNLGYIAMMLRAGIKPTNPQEAIEYLSTKLGLVMLILGFLHLMNVFVFSRMRRRAVDRNDVVVGAELIKPVTPRAITPAAPKA